MTNPAPMACYQSLRFLQNGSTTPLLYSVPNLTPGAVYKLRLHFASFSDGGSGRRLISVAVNGTSAISSLDVYASAGGDLIAFIEEVTGTADGTGTLTLSFTADLMKTYPVPFINAIEVMSAGVLSNKYDPVGNLVLTTDWTGLTTLTWNGENRLLGVASGLNGTESYQYAAYGMRRQKITSAQTTNFVCDGQNVLQERSQANARLSQYTDYPGYWGGLASGCCGALPFLCAVLMCCSKSEKHVRSPSPPCDST